MINIIAILQEAGIELTEEQKKQVTDGIKENYKPIADYDKQVAKIKQLEDDLKTSKETLQATQEDLKKLEGVDTEGMQKKIDELNETIKKNQESYDKQMADRDFSDILDKAITEAKGKNSKAIKALLDVEALKGSKNQVKDIEAAIKTLTEAEDSKMLFGEAEPEKKGTGNPIGSVSKGSESKEPTMAEAIADFYK